METNHVSYLLVPPRPMSPMVSEGGAQLEDSDRGFSGCSQTVDRDCSISRLQWVEGYTFKFTHVVVGRLSFLMAGPWSQFFVKWASLQDYLSFSKKGRWLSLEQVRRESRSKREILQVCVLVSSGCRNKIPQTGGLKHRHLLPHYFGRQKSRIKVLAESVAGEGSLPGLQTTTSSHSLPSVCAWRDRDLQCRFLLKGMGLTLMTSFNSNYFPKDPISKYNHTGRSGLQYTDGGGGYNFVHITVIGILK